MAEVTWFKVLTDIFADDKIKIIQSMPEGDSLLVTWFKVLSQAGKTNDGGYIYLRKNIPYTPAMLATLFNKPQMIVELALKTFTQFEMIDIDENGYIFVTNWEKHQSIDALEKIKEQDRIRAASYRERKRLELKESHVTLTLPSHSNHATEVELDSEKEKEKNNTTTSDDYELIRVRFRELHALIDLPYQDSPLLTKLLADDIPRSTIIGVMESRFKASAKTLKYYEAAIREAHQNIIMPKAAGGESFANYRRNARGHTEEDRLAAERDQGLSNVIRPDPEKWSEMPEVQRQRLQDYIRST